MYNNPRIKLLLIALAILCGALMLLYPVYINHFPLVFSDSGTYIDSGFRNYVPDDRPIVYGLFIRHCSLKASLFLSILAQALLVSSCIYVCCNAFLSSFSSTLKCYSVAIVLLTICTGLPWISSWIMPDICTGLSFLLLLILLFAQKSFSCTGLILLVICYYFTTLSHLTNILSELVLVGPLLLLLLCLKKQYRDQFLPVRRTMLIILLICSNYLVLPLINLSFGGGFRTAKGSSVFLTAKLCGYGLLKDHLDHHCDQGQYKLCAYKDSLPGSGPELLWNYSGALYKTGGWSDENILELSRLNNDILKQPQYMEVFVKRGIEGTIEQLFLFNVGNDFIPYDSSSAPFAAINWHLKKDVPYFNQSKQNRAELHFNFSLLNSIQSKIFFACVIIALLLAIFRPFQRVDLAILASFILLAGNAAACAFFSDIGNRYQSRVIWVVIMLTVIQITQKIAPLSGKPQKDIQP